MICELIDVWWMFFLLAMFQVKHFFADYTSQTPYMLKKFLPGKEFILPLAAHAGVHAAYTLMFALIIAPRLWWLALVDFVAHFTMDRIKASPKMLGRFRALSASEMKGILSYKDTVGLGMFKKELDGNKYFWWSLGFDQMIHHLTHYFIVYMLVTQ